jgi:DNA-binding transcriptional regulator YiaG
MSFADELKRWRGRLELTQAEAAALLQVPVRTLEEWEQDRAAPSQTGAIRQLMKLAQDRHKRKAS